MGGARILVIIINEEIQSVVQVRVRHRKIKRNRSIGYDIIVRRGEDFLSNTCMNEGGVVTYISVLTERIGKDDRIGMLCDGVVETVP